MNKEKSNEEIMADLIMAGKDMPEGSEEKIGRLLNVLTFSGNKVKQAMLPYSATTTMFIASLFETWALRFGAKENWRINGENEDSYNLMKRFNEEHPDIMDNIIPAFGPMLADEIEIQVKITEEMMREHPTLQQNYTRLLVTLLLETDTVAGKWINDQPYCLPLI